MTRRIWAFDTEDNSQGECTLINFFNGVEHFTFYGAHEREKAMAFLEAQDPMILWGVNAE